ncbi:10112_t:CDS:10 [Acaulospora colombiana]|uniref:10112_t:CDS:1 n=1 Tax=Acaulospora colombiana TaxID=27376 RepID=A0ACA9LEY7_9GLOM|nr:10112_t:CDS:10 [Acaulospora colombiana]
MKSEYRADSVYRTTITTGGVASAQSQNLTFSESLYELNGLDHAVYNDGTILLRVTAPGNKNQACDGGLNLRLIYPNGNIAIVNFNNSDLQIPSDNYCPANRSEFTGPGVTSGSVPDAIRIYAIPDHYILVTYFQADNKTHGAILDWSGNVLSNNTNLGDTCDNSEIIPNHNTVDGGFLRRTAGSCYLSIPVLMKIRVPSSIENSSSDGSINVISNGTLNTQNRISNFSPNLTKIFVTENGNYCMITSNYTAVTSTWNLFASYIAPTNNSTQSSSSDTGPFQVYETSVNASATLLNIYSCGLSYASIGYSCLVYNGQEFATVDFTSSGSVLAMNEIQNPPLTPNEILTGLPLFYGGTLVVTRGSNGSTDGWVFGDTSVSTNASLQNTYKYLQVGVFLNNSVWIIGVGGNSNATNEWTISTFSSFSDFSTINGGAQNASGGPGPYGCAFIQSAVPAKGTFISQYPVHTINITYSTPGQLQLSTGNISIWQSNSSSDSYDLFGGKYDILRQTISGSNSNYVSLSNGNKTVVVKVLSSTFDQPNTDYYVTIDNDFVVESTYGQPLLGVRRNVWLFNSGNLETDKSTIRLTTFGSSYYVSLSESEKDKFVQQFASQLASIIPCTRSRVYLRTKYQYDYTLPNRDQILFRVYIYSNKNVANVNKNSKVQDVSPISVIFDMNTLIINKNVTGISNGLLSLLDDTYGANVARNRALGTRNNKAWNVVIFLFAFIIVDFVLDISFISLHGRDLTWTYSVSLILLMVPIAMNTATAFFLVSYEQSRSRFLEWWLMYPKTGFIFLMLSLIDVDFWNIVSSGFAGIRKFDAPLDPRTRKYVFFLNIVNLIIEDVGQAIVLVRYQENEKSQSFPSVFGKASGRLDGDLIKSRRRHDTDDPLDDTSGSQYLGFWKKKKSRHRKNVSSSSSSGSEFYTPGEYKGFAADYVNNNNNDEKNDVPEISDAFVVNTDVTGKPFLSLKKMDAPVHSVSHGKKVEDAITNIEESYTPSEQGLGAGTIYGSGKIYGSETSIAKRSSNVGIIGHTGRSKNFGIIEHTGRSSNVGIIGHTGRIFEGEEAIIEEGESGLSERGAAVESSDVPAETLTRKDLTGETPRENIDDQDMDTETETEKARRGGPQLTKFGSVDTYHTSSGGTDTTISRTNTTISGTTLESDGSFDGGVRRASSSSKIRKEVSSEMMSDIVENDEGSML